MVELTKSGGRCGVVDPAIRGCDHISESIAGARKTPYRAYRESNPLPPSAGPA